MYVTAHRVTKPSDGRTGINCYVHLHRKVIGVDSTWGGGEVREISDHQPGDLVRKAINLAPGGNRVLSYLDIVCEDTVSAEHISRFLDRFDEVKETERILSLEGIVGLFSTTAGLAGEEDIEFSALKAAVMASIQD